MQYITLHAVVPTAALDVATQHSPYAVAGTFEIREGMTYHDLYNALEESLDDVVDPALIDGLVRSMFHEDPRHYAKWSSDVYALQPFDDTYSVIVTGEY